MNDKDENKTPDDKIYSDLKWKYELIIKARNFHYENFNKWMTYFYVMISALVLGLCNILSKQDVDIFDKQRNIVLVISFLGFIVSLAWLGIGQTKDIIIGTLILFLWLIIMKKTF